MYIRVKVWTRAKEEKIKKIKEDSFEIWLREKAERNLANNRLLEILADYFKLNKNKIRIINGHHNSSKLLVLDAE